MTEHGNQELEQGTPAPSVWEGEGSRFNPRMRRRADAVADRFTPPQAVHVAQTTSLHRIAMLGNHLPRRCGLATFTTDLSAALSAASPALECFVLAMNDTDRRYEYPARVRFEITADDLASYHRAAIFLQLNPVDLVSVQHEYGIFGGDAGAHVLALLRELHAPIVTTLHTILAAPDPAQRRALDELTQLSERLVVMSADGASLLREVHNVAAAKIDIIPHGIPSLPDTEQSRARLGLESKSVILTFGLLSPDKGIEYVIDAMPAILERFPDAIYIVLGATHPHVKDRDGEQYRTMLENRARMLAVDQSVVFHNRFVDSDTLTTFLAAADIYITPYLNPQQITSGTLAYALGCGKAVISTPYSYARELLAEGRGILVSWPQNEPGAISHAINTLLGDDKLRAGLGARGFGYGRHMSWPKVARSYNQTFERARADHAERSRATIVAGVPATQPQDLPAVDLRHVLRLSDATGILQHAAYDVPRHIDGYCLDDNARALLLMTKLQGDRVEDVGVVRSLASRYLAYVLHSFDVDTGRFRNFMLYSRQWADAHGSQDCHGRALWALGSVVAHADELGRRSLASALFHTALTATEGFSSPRAWAYALLGIDEYLRVLEGDRRVATVRAQLAERLLTLYRSTRSQAWPWFEERATYCSARLSQALLVSGWRMGNDIMQAAGLQSLEWLAEVQRAPSGDGTFAPIGSNGFYARGGTKAAFDQQPVEACAMVSACLAAQQATGDGRWGEESHRAFNWFTGQNQLHLPLYDVATGGCRDGLHADRVNENQGAESTLSFLLALVEMRSAARSARIGPPQRTRSRGNGGAP